MDELPQSDNHLTQQFAASTKVARADLYVALVSPGVDPTISNSVFDRTIGLVRVCAVGEAATAYIRAQLAEEAGDLFGDHVPKLKLADAWRVDDVAAERERDKLCGRGCMATLLRFLAYGLHAQMEIWLDGV